MDLFSGLCLLLTAHLPADTIPLQRNLDSVTVTAFANRTSLRDAAAAIVVVNDRTLSRFSPASAVSAVNSVPGVRMEERSPGSYRLAIRGSSLRSPFGVRNIRMYYQELPFTDPGGNTYLNQLSVSNLAKLEVLKGPASSLYGAGTGGTILASSPSPESKSYLQLYTGDYASQSIETGISLKTKQAAHRIAGSHLQSNGFRNHSSMKRSVLSYQAQWSLSPHAVLNALAMYGDLWYQTPGGLNRTEFETDPRQSRPAAGTNPSAVAADAAISQRTLYGGLHHQWKPSTPWQLDLSAYGARTAVSNPAIRNFEERSEPHFGGRINIGYTRPLGEQSRLRLNTGGEWQQGHYSVTVFSNNAGNPGSLQTDDRLKPRTTLLFGQGILDLPHAWQLTAGISFNANKVRITRVSESPAFRFTSNYRNEWMPRLAVTKKTGSLTFYATSARGFSPPTTSELLPSTSIINTSLQAENGWNQELGLRGRLLRNRLYFDINFFYFRLKDAIVLRRDASGADFFENAGSTRQSGLESYLAFQVIAPASPNALALDSWLSFSNHPFQYLDLRQGETDLSGNALPGVAKNTLSTGIDITAPRATSLHLTWQYIDPLWLNDANTARAPATRLLGLKLGTRAFSTPAWMIRIFAGADNLLNETYSLGYDINAFGGRYYNLSPGRNFFAGIRFELQPK